MSELQRVPVGPVAGGFFEVAIPPAFGAHSEEQQEREFCRALLSADELAELKAENNGGYLTVKEIRDLIDENVSARYTHEGVFVFDGELVKEIDVRSNQPLFVLPNNEVLSRDDLFAKYPFAELATTPERIFAQQELAVFAAPAAYMDQSGKEYLVRDVGSREDLVTFEDFVGRGARKDYVDRRPAERIYKTKVFLARDGWEDFVAISKHIRAIRRIGGGALSAAFGGAIGARAPTAALESSEGLAQRLEQQEKNMAEREERLKRQQEEFDARVELQKREFEAQTKKLCDLIAGL